MWPLDALLDLVLPQQCAGCRTPRALLCPRCEALLTAAPRLARPTPAPPGLPAPWTVTTYEGPVRALIVAHKERARLPLAEPLGRALAQSTRAALATNASVPCGERAVVVPVPSGRAAVRGRGHDATRRMARVAVRELRGMGVPVVRVDALRQGRRVADQAGLPAAARAVNLAGAFEVVERVDGRRVVVVDDVVTSGASLAEAARALRAAGAVVVGAATVAATPRKW